MEEQNTNAVFDDVARDAAVDLLEQFWILREREPEKYLQVRNREQALRSWFRDKAGLRLITHRYFVKLEKIPAQLEPWMGISPFQRVRDYVLFCCLLAFLEGLAVEEQFLLSNLCEGIEGFYPGPGQLHWNNFEHRKSLVRVMRYAEDMGILLSIEGEIENFGAGETEVLYEVPVAARYFMRSFPRELESMKDPEEILAAEQPADQGVARRYKIYRQLLFGPVMYSQDAADPDFLYLRNRRNRIRDDIEDNFEFQFELYKNAALLTTPERRAKLTYFPDNRTISDIAIQFAGLARDIKEQEDIPIQYDGSISLPRSAYISWVGQLREKFSHGWSKQYRELDTQGVARELLAHLKDWKLAQEDKETRVISLLPVLARFSGHYPEDFSPEGEDTDDR
jgi:uncharacterized protein (TIGR02678 family)